MILFLRISCKSITVGTKTDQCLKSGLRVGDEEETAETACKGAPGNFLVIQVMYYHHNCVGGYMIVYPLTPKKATKKSTTIG